MDNDERREAYNCDITYITNNELGFDYLRDNMVIYKSSLYREGFIMRSSMRWTLYWSTKQGHRLSFPVRVVNPHVYNEACDILAHQLIRGEESQEFSKMDAIMGVEIEETGDFIVNEKDKVINLTQEGVKKVEQFFRIDNLADAENLEIQHNIILALRANYLMFKDQDYVVQDDEVLIVDDFTGRIMPGRRYSDGLHRRLKRRNM